MVAVRMVQMVGDAVVDVVAVRHRLVTAIGAMDMIRRMPGAAMVRGAPLGVAAGDFDHVLVDMIVMRVVEMTLMQIVDVAGMAHGGVAAARPVAMRMVGVVGVRAGRHFNHPFGVRYGSRPRDR